MNYKLTLMLTVFFTTALPALAGKTYKAHTYYKWTTNHGPHSSTECDRGQILEIKEIAARNALDACYEDGNSYCKTNGATILVNGDLVSEEYYRIMGESWPPSILSPYYYGCIARGSATAQ